MTAPPSAIVRAFQLARSGRISVMKQLKDELRAEGYTQAEIHNGLYGRSTTMALRRLCAEFRAQALTAELEPPGQKNIL